MKNTKQTIAENIRFYRRQKKLRQKDIADYFHISDNINPIIPVFPMLLFRYSGGM